MFASLDAVDFSCEGGQLKASLAIATSGAMEAEAEADSGGYEGDVGEETDKLTASVRRATVIAPPGFSVNRVSRRLRAICSVTFVWRNTLALLPKYMVRRSNAYILSVTPPVIRPGHITLLNSRRRLL